MYMYIVYLNQKIIIIVFSFNLKNNHTMYKYTNTLYSTCTVVDTIIINTMYKGRLLYTCTCTCKT